MTHILALALAAGLFVQAPADTANRVTVTGCVERADQVTQTGTLGTTVDSLDFVLIKSNDSSSAVGTTGTEPTTGRTASAATAPAVGNLYWLDGETGKLNAHVGHKVEISGTVRKAGDAGGATAIDPLANAATLKVDSVKMIAATCPRE